MPDANTAGKVWMEGSVGHQQRLNPDGTPRYSQSIPDKVREVMAKTMQFSNEGNVGVKHDAGKPRVDLLDPQALEGLAAVLTFGAQKYAAHNWRGGMPYGRLIAAALRHLFAIMRGEDLDPESGLPHVDHLGCCWMFLSWNMKNRPDLDDRWKGK